MIKKIALLACLLMPATAPAQQTETVKIDELLKMLSTRSDKVLVVNFWATWCAPCVAELPLFERLNEERNADVDVALVSLDMILDPDTGKVHKFVQRKNLRSRVLLLDADNENDWIDKVDTRWSGALPATLVIDQKTGNRKFVGKPLAHGDLERLVREVQQGN